jgi:SnoaL-like domain
MVNDTYQQKLQRMSDLESIRTLKARYCHCVDTGYLAAGDDPDALAQLFVENGEWVVGSGAVRGLDAIREHAQSLAKNLRLHLIGAPRVTLDGDHAQGNWHVLVPSTSSDGSATWMAGTYDDKFVRTGDGWRFESIAFVPAFRANYDDGWGTMPDPSGSISRTGH